MITDVFLKNLIRSLGFAFLKMGSVRDFWVDFLVGIWSVFFLVYGKIVWAK